MSFTTYKENFLKFKDFMGPRVWKLFMLSVVIGILWFGVEIFFIYVIQTFLRALGLADKAQMFIPEFLPTSVYGSLIFLLLFGLGRAVIYVIKDYFTGITNQAFVRDQREKVVNYCLNNAHITSKHEVVTVFNERINQSGGVIIHIATIIHTVTTSSLLLFYGIRLAPLELFIGLALISTLIIPLKLLDKKIDNYGQGLTKESAKANKFLLLGMQNNFFLKLYNLLGIEVNKLENSLENYETYYKKHHIVQSVKNAIPQFGGLAIISIITWIGLEYTHTPKLKLLSFFYIFLRISQSMGLLAQTIASMKLNLPNFKHLYEWHQYHKSFVQRKTFAELQNKDLEACESEFFNDLDSKGISINADKIGFGYDENKKLFNHLNIKANQGDVILISGPSGSGKTTLLTLLTGLTYPTSGKISINNYDLKNVIKSFRKKIAYVGPDPYLIPATVRENLLYGNDQGESVSDEKIWQALQKAELYDTIKGLKNQLDEELNEMTQLSTGQKQRLSMARAFLKDAKVIILDEATANLDLATEARIIKQIDQMKDDVITFIISHKNSFDHLASKRVNLGKDSLHEQHVY